MFEYKMKIVRITLPSYKKNENQKEYFQDIKTK
jgi:hypothetical protein